MSITALAARTEEASACGELVSHTTDQQGDALALRMRKHVAAKTLTRPSASSLSDCARLVQPSVSNVAQATAGRNRALCVLAHIFTKCIGGHCASGESP